VHLEDEGKAVGASGVAAALDGETEEVSPYAPSTDEAMTPQTIARAEHWKWSAVSAAGLSLALHAIEGGSGEKAGESAGGGVGGVWSAPGTSRLASGLVLAAAWRLLESKSAEGAVPVSPAAAGGAAIAFAGEAEAEEEAEAARPFFAACIAAERAVATGTFTGGGGGGGVMAAADAGASSLGGSSGGRGCKGGQRGAGFASPKGAASQTGSTTRKKKSVAFASYDFSSVG
jgi:hypothetical protein